MEFYPENQLKDRKNLSRRGWMKLKHMTPPIKQHFVDYPPLHPKKFFYLKKVYGSFTVDIDDIYSKEFYDKTTLSIVNKLISLWEKIKPDINSNLCNEWLDNVFKYYMKQYFYFPTSTEEKLSYIYKHIKKYYPNFDPEKYKPLIIRYLLTCE